MVTAAATVAALVLVPGTASASLPVEPTLTISSPTRAASAAAVCAGLERLSACRPLALVVEQRTTSGQILGHAEVSIQRTETLSATSRTWHHKVAVNVVASRGTVRGHVIQVRPLCKGGCSLSPRLTSFGLVAGTRRTFDFTAGLSGSATRTAAIKVEFRDLQGGSRTATPLGDVRCDSASYLGAKGGCVHPAGLALWTLKRADPAVTAVASHIATAQASLPGHPGQYGYRHPLHRITDAAQIARNRRTVCPPSLPRPPGQTCDEYPFASTAEGGDPRGFSRAMVPAAQNSAAGGRLSAFLKANRIMAKDGYYVAIG